MAQSTKNGHEIWLKETGFAGADWIHLTQDRNE
jgi:hypothetical protein